MLKIIQTTERYTKKPNRKTVYNLDEIETTEITAEQYRNIVESAPFFRRLGGSVTQERGYTCNGYKVVKDTATSPDRERKTVRKFNFQY